MTSPQELGQRLRVTVAVLEDAATLIETARERMGEQGMTRLGQALDTIYEVRDDLLSAVRHAD